MSYRLYFCLLAEYSTVDTKELPSLDHTPSRLNAAGTLQKEASASPNLKEKEIIRKSIEDAGKAAETKEQEKIQPEAEHTQGPSTMALQQECNLQACQAYLGRMPAPANPYMATCFTPNDYMAAFQRQIITHQNGGANAPFHFAPSMDCYMPRPITQAPNIMSQLSSSYHGILPSLLYSQPWNFPQPGIPLPKLPIPAKINNTQTITK